MNKIKAAEGNAAVIVELKLLGLILITLYIL